MNVEVNVEAVETIIGHTFLNRKLLEDALTHSSFHQYQNFERLEFLGDIALSLSLSNHLFLTYPSLQPYHLSLLRAANVSTDRLARLCVRHRLQSFLRHRSPTLLPKIQEFAEAVAEEGDLVAHGGSVKAPKVLADILESVAGAVYVDVDFDIQKFWLIIRGLLEPLVTPDIVSQQPQPVTMLYELCQKNGKQVDIKYWRNDGKTIASVYVDGQFVTSASSDQKDIAKLDAAKLALDKIANSLPANTSMLEFSAGVDGSFEIEFAKHELNELCGKKKWSKPIFSITNTEGQPHQRIFVCSVQVTTTEGTFQMTGERRTRVRDAENSAASLMIQALQECNHL
ncbi:hypothetical protein HN51_023749 [Arachis hypogaea]|uniref:Uncharacterized protein n=1 Tax=Arachis hypogaea TaxID=3818 RepID=A0A445C3E1_ARAHY|nr:ribonuclease 3-like protein 2 [Arachis hypogaea]QHO26690.1 Ribonuclease 3-like protein [Arachis hypogaea]RYR45437.1 hypothetical protein Ahy_A07g031265 [Arachis hypogaea]